jgi:uncharacterized protein YjbI with pentapeptide repeats
MHIVKPQMLGMSFRPVEHRHRYGVNISGYLHVPFDQGASGRLWGEQSMWDFLAGEMAVPMIDEGVLKLTPEFLVIGQAYPQPDRADAVAVRAELAGVSKTVFAFGDRYWLDRKSASAPAPFERMSLDWSRAYGGDGFAANPTGRGRMAQDGVRWLPNLELPQSRLMRADQEIEPAGFGPLDTMHPQRVAFNGTYDEAWLKEHSPAVAPDTQWKHFNIAPKDQWIPAPLRGDESFVLENMHPTQARIDGRLPGLRVRMFANYEIPGPDGPGFKLREIAMRLTTVWFFPHAERMVLIYQGLAETEEDDGFDIKHLLGAVERLEPDPSRNDEYYLQEFRNRTAGGIMAGLHLLNDVALLPPGIALDDPALEASQAPLKAEGFKEAAARLRAQADVEIARQRVRAKGQDPDALGIRLAPPEKPPTPAEMPQYIENLTKKMADEQWAAVEQMVTAAEKVLEGRKQGKYGPESVHRGPPTFRASAQLDLMQNTAIKAGGKFDRAPLEGPMAMAEIAKRMQYQQDAHLQAPAHPLTGDKARERREEIEWLLDNGVRKWPTLDLTGADLSNLDLRGVDLSLAWLESADLRYANLSRANLSGAVLAHANLTGVVAIGTDFSKANLGGAQLEGALMDRSNLSGCTLARTKLIRTSLRGALLSGASLLESEWTEVDLSEAVAVQQLFHKLDLTACTFVGAHLGSASFIECKIERADFSRASMPSAQFVTCAGARSVFREADLSSGGLLAASSFAGADFSGATMKGANFGDSDFTEARLIRTVIDGANLTRTRLARCDARQAKAKGALLRKADLRGSSWSGTDFKDCILSGADLRGADLSDSHFFGADLTRVRLDTDVKLDGAVLERARTFPRRRPRATDPST